MDSAPTPYSLITDPAGLREAVTALESAGTVGIDLETTGLNARKDPTRLIAVATDRHCWVVDCQAVDPAPLLECLTGKQLAGHNIGFDLAFLARWGLQAAAVQDTMMIAQVLHSGEHGVRYSLAEVTQRHLAISLSKELQRSDWTGPLTPDQIAYAAGDASILLPLLHKLALAVGEAGLADAVAIENRCLPALVWMGQAGVPIDEDAWRALSVQVGVEAQRLRDEMDRAAPRPLVLDLGFGWNWESPQETLEALKAAGCDVPNANEDTLSTLDHPLAMLLRRYRENRKLASTYGLEWLKHLDNGRVYPDWRQLGASSGRMACSSPNLQQIPRARAYRACIAAPPGRVLIKADYSQIELRIAARIAGEDRMIRAYEAREDLHTLTAQRVLGKSEITREDRQLAKAINFGLLYGMGAEGFRRYARVQYGVILSEDEAVRYRTAFFDSYPRLQRWHRSVRDSRVHETRTLSGRRRLLDTETPLPLRLNLPVQGTGADGLKLALAILWERRCSCPGAVPIIACHDEIVVECPADRAEETAAWLRQAMLDGMAPLILPVPVEVEVSIGQSWAGE